MNRSNQPNIGRSISPSVGSAKQASSGSSAKQASSDSSAKLTPSGRSARSGDLREPAGADFLQLRADEAPVGGLAEWLTDRLRSAISDGRLPVGSRLPASRVLAAELRVSRGVVTEAYQRLTEDGHVEGRGRAGTVVLAAPIGATSTARRQDEAAPTGAADGAGGRARPLDRSKPDAGMPGSQTPGRTGTPDEHTPGTPGVHTLGGAGTPSGHAGGRSGIPGGHTPGAASTPGVHASGTAGAPIARAPGGAGTPDPHTPGAAPTPSGHAPSRTGTPDRYTPGAAGTAGGGGSVVGGFPGVPGLDVFDVMRAVPARLDLTPGVPDLAAFPRAAWLKAERTVLTDLSASAFGYGDPAGTPRLRLAVANWLARNRGIKADPDDLIIVAGVSQALALIAQVFTQTGSTDLAVEDPGSLGSRQHLQNWGMRTPPIPVDEDGLRVDELRRSGARAVLVTPAHQFPTGVVMGGERRRELMQWALDGGVIVEDDYDAEHRYDRPPVPALRAMLTEHVIYAGSISKLLAPALRIGWMLPPPQYRDALIGAKRLADLGNAGLPQLVVAQLMESGELERQLRFLRKRHRQRRDAMIDAISKYLPGATVHGAAAGLHLTITFDTPPNTPAPTPDALTDNASTDTTPNHAASTDTTPYDVALDDLAVDDVALDDVAVDDVALADAAVRRGVKTQPLSWHSQRPQPPGLVLGYAARTPTEITTAISLIAGCLRPKT